MRVIKKLNVLFIADEEEAIHASDYLFIYGQYILYFGIFVYTLTGIK